MLTLDQERSRAADEENKPAGERDKPAFGWLPDEWARDSKISASCLCILAYRCTFANDKRAFGLWEDCLSKNPILTKGFGEGVRSEAIRDAVKLGLLDRPHNSKLPRGPGYTFQRSVDRLNPPEQLDRNNSRKVWRSWFTAVLTCNEMGALIFFRAGTGKGKSVYARELKERFDWSLPTAHKALRGLRSRGIVVMERPRGAEGRLDGVTYFLRPDLGMQLPAATSEQAATHKKPSHGSPGDGPPSDGLPGDIRNTSPHVSPLEKLPKRREYTSRLAARGFVTSLKNENNHPSAHEAAADVEDQAWQSSIILGWIPTFELRDDWSDVGTELLEQVRQVCGDQELAALVETATAGRVHKSILSPTGCYGVRYLASFLLAKDDGTSPEDALKQVLQAMWIRIGSREGEWLNSLGLIGKRFDGETCEGDEFYASTRDTEPDPFEG